MWRHVAHRLLHRFSVSMSPSNPKPPPPPLLVCRAPSATCRDGFRCNRHAFACNAFTRTASYTVPLAFWHTCRQRASHLLGVGNSRLGLEEVEVAVTGEGGARGTGHGGTVVRHLGGRHGHAGRKCADTGIAAESCTHRRGVNMRSWNHINLALVHMAQGPFRHSPETSSPSVPSRHHRPAQTHSTDPGSWVPPPQRRPRSILR